MKTLSPKTCKMVRLIYGWVFTAFTVIVGALFIWQVLDIYIGGTKAGLATPFNYDDVVSRIKSIVAVPFWIWIGLIFAGFIVWEVFPVKERLTPITDARYVLYRLSKRIPAEVDGEMKEAVQLVNEQQRLLKITHCLLLGGVAAVYVAYIVAYMANVINFPNVNKTAEVLQMALYILPVAAIIFAAGCIYVTLLNRSAKRMLPQVKKLTAGIKAPQPVQPNKFMWIITHKYFKLGVRIAVACVGVAFVIAGCFNGSVQEVFSKAITICTECIGLG